MFLLVVVVVVGSTLMLIPWILVFADSVSIDINIVVVVVVCVSILCCYNITVFSLLMVLL